MILCFAILYFFQACFAVYPSTKIPMSLSKGVEIIRENYTFTLQYVTHPVDTIHGNSKLIIRFANNMLQAHCARHIEDYIRI